MLLKINFNCFYVGFDAQIFTNAAAPSGIVLAGYYDVGGYGSAEIYC